MTVKKFKQLLDTWPDNYKVVDEMSRDCAAVMLDRVCGKKGSVWIKFKRNRCKNCGQEIRKT